MLQQLAEECGLLVPALRSYLETSNLTYRSSQDGNIITGGWQRCHCCPLPALGGSLGSCSARASMPGHAILCHTS